MQAMGLMDVQQTLRQLQLDIQIIEFDSSTATSQLAAERVGCEPGQIVKSLGFMIDRTAPILVLTSGDHTVDDRKLAALFAVGRKKVRMMKAEQCVAILGYAPGGVPPIGHRQPGLPMFLDKTLKRYELVYAAGGTAQTIFPIALTALQQVTQANFADVVKD